MGFFSTKPATNPMPVTSTSLADQLNIQMDRSQKRLDARKDRALSSFRRTVMDLRHVNKALDNDIDLCDKLMAELSQRKDAALTARTDNEKVIDGIIAIIGDVPDNFCYDENDDGTCDNCGEEIGHE